MKAEKNDSADTREREKSKKKKKEKMRSDWHVWETFMLSRSFLFVFFFIAKFAPL